MLGGAFYRDNLQFLDGANVGLSSGSLSRLSVNFKFNGVLQPQSQADSLWMQVAAHRFEHVPEFNNIAYSDDPMNPQFLNEIQADIRDLEDW